jgi:hypothetical protein
MFQRVGKALFVGAVCLISGTAIFGQTIVKEKPAVVSVADLSGGGASAKSKDQTTAGDDRRFEAGVTFTSLSRSGDGDRVGFGGRFTYDFARFGGGKYIAALDTEVSFLPGQRFVSTPRSDGRVFQGFSGLKIGRKWDKVGVFAKARPGFTQYSKGREIISGSYASPVFNYEKETNFAFDTGGILEFYPSKKITTRFDFGDTMVKYGQRNAIGFDFINSALTPLRLPGSVKHNFQFSAGIGFRF